MKKEIICPYCSDGGDMRLRRRYAVVSGNSFKYKCFICGATSPPTDTEEKATIMAKHIPILAKLRHIEEVYQDDRR